MEKLKKEEVKVITNTFALLDVVKEIDKNSTITQEHVKLAAKEPVFFRELKKKLGNGFITVKDDALLEIIILTAKEELSGALDILIKRGICFSEYHFLEVIKLTAEKKLSGFLRKMAQRYNMPDGVFVKVIDFIDQEEFSEIFDIMFEQEHFIKYRSKPKARISFDKDVELALLKLDIDGKRDGVFCKMLDKLDSIRESEHYAEYDSGTAINQETELEILRIWVEDGDDKYWKILKEKRKISYTETKNKIIDYTVEGKIPNVLKELIEEKAYFDKDTIEKILELYWRGRLNGILELMINNEYIVLKSYKNQIVEKADRRVVKLFLEKFYPGVDFGL